LRLFLKSIIGFISLFAVHNIVLAQANAITIGVEVSQKNFTDQYERNLLIQKTTEWIFFAPDHAASEIMNQVLEGKEQHELAQKNMVYLADISKMPSLVSRFVALPNMQKLKYSIGLGQDAQTLAMFPRQKASVTILRLESWRVVEIRFSQDSHKLKDLLVTGRL